MKSVVRTTFFMLALCALLSALGKPARAEFTGLIKPLDCAPYTGTKADYNTGYATLYRDTENHNYNYYEGMGSHPGVDISKLSNGNSAFKAPVRAIYGGRIAKVYNSPDNKAYNGGWGYCIVIRHEGIPDAGTIFSCYGHMSRFERSWSQNDWINKGDIIGYVGNTGNSTGPHLHFQIDKDYNGGVHPFFPKNVNAPDSKGDVLNHTISPMKFVQDHTGAAIPVTPTPVPPKSPNPPAVFRNQPSLPTGWAGKNADGRQQIYVLGPNREVLTKWQTQLNGAWSGWQSLGGSWTSNPVIGLNADGRQQIYVRGNNGVIYTKWQTHLNGAWVGDWQAFGGLYTVGSPTVCSNADGRQQIFARGGDGVIYTKWQTELNGGWSGWEAHRGITASGDPFAFYNADGRQQIYVRASDNAIWTKWQVELNGRWSGWLRFPSNVSGNPTVCRNADGRQQLYVRGTDGAIYTMWQVELNGGWSGWQKFDSNVSGEAIAWSNADGRQQIYVRGTDNVLYTKWQQELNGGWYPSWQPFGGISTSGNPALYHNADGRQQLFTRGTDGVIYTRWQIELNGGWSDWARL
jgi:hypothetical protein